MQWAGERFRFESEHVMGVDGPQAYIRTYLEHRDLRKILTDLARKRDFCRAVDLGCGFGRLSMVLAEFCRSVRGFEREPHLVKQAQALMPELKFEAVHSLDRLPAPDEEFDLLLSFTVLQHIPESQVLKVGHEIKRVLRPQGLAILCEETDERLHAGNMNEPSLLSTVGRPISFYESLMEPFKLIHRSPRVVEPTFFRKDVGTYMIFSCA